MVAALPLARDSSHDEARFVLEGVPWWTYVALRDALETELVRAYQAALRGR